MKVAIVGAGVFGSAIAMGLAQHGAEVTLIDAHGPGSGTSSRGAGLVGAGLWHPTGIHLALRSSQLLRELSDSGKTDGHPFRYLEPGSWTLVGQKDVEGARALAKLQRAHGVEVHERAPPEDMRSDDVAAAFHYPRDGWSWPRFYCEAASFLLEEAGVTTQKKEVRLANVDADEIVVAAGVHTRALLRDAGIDLPLLAYRTQATRILHPRAHELPILHDTITGWYMRPGTQGHLVAGNGTTTTPEDANAWKSQADEDFVAKTLARLRARFPHMRDARVDEAWAGIDAATPDRLLLAGKLRDGLWVCAGGNGHGFMRAPATGESLAAMIMGKTPRTNIDAYDPQRFAGKAPDFQIREGYSIHPADFK